MSYFDLSELIRNMPSCRHKLKLQTALETRKPWQIGQSCIAHVWKDNRLIYIEYFPNGSYFHIYDEYVNSQNDAGSRLDNWITYSIAELIRFVDVHFNNLTSELLNLQILAYFAKTKTLHKQL